ncbi:CHAP domain-containing protein [Nonomuraea sp. FMUSA5-5]|uniref:CHAP domain-containing protein n=1 Tax=Nonomuraea composti TaxID=2720023 RepID=A0ABX1AV60_9ACTN|nr:CHAP domain-containing protein [Nonomuraea sp. FMUSA5-5]
MRQELGYKEKSGQFTKFGQWYADRVQDTQYRDAPWCDMFLSWAANKSGLSDYVGEFAWTPSHAAWFIQQNAWSRRPEPGALVFYDWRGGKSYKGIDHVGIVERVEGRKIHTIEANVDRVWLKRKTRETDKVVGYGIPRLVKANLERLDEIRSTERPFISPPRSGDAHGSPLDLLGTPPALLAAMVLMTIVLSLRVTGRRRGTHRRLPWLPGPTAPPPPSPPTPRVPSPRNPLTPLRHSAPAGEGALPASGAAVRDGAPPAERAPEHGDASLTEASLTDQAKAQPQPRTVAPTDRSGMARVPAGAGRSTPKPHPTTKPRPTPKRRKPYDAS